MSIKFRNSCALNKLRIAIFGLSTLILWRTSYAILLASLRPLGPCRLKIAYRLVDRINEENSRDLKVT